MRASIALFLACICGTTGFAGAPGYEPQTVRGILALGKAADEQLFDVTGTFLSGGEINALIDDDCGQDSATHCSVWVRFDACNQPNGMNPCLVTLQAIPRVPYGAGVRAARIRARGIVHSVRKDVTYPPSFPAAAKIGFGHLGAFPAEIDVQIIARTD